MAKSKRHREENDLESVTFDREKVAQELRERLAAANEDADFSEKASRITQEDLRFQVSL